MVVGDYEGYNGMVAQWVVFAIMAVTAIVFSITVQFRPIPVRLAYYVNIAICTIAATAYYAMAVNADNTTPSNDDRQVVYARYIDWIFTTPLLLLDLILMTNMPSTMTAWIMGADVAMVVFGIIGAFTAYPYKWVYFAAGCLMQVALSWGMIQPILKEDYQKNATCTKGYTALLIFLIVVWVVYPVAWGLGAGGRVISVDTEIIIMGVLDLLAKPLFAVGVLTMHEVTFGAASKKQEEKPLIA